MRTSTLSASQISISQQKTPASIFNDKGLFSESISLNPIIQEKLINQQPSKSASICSSTTHTSNVSSSTTDFINQFNLLLSNQLANFSNDFCQKSTSEVIGRTGLVLNERRTAQSQEQTERSIFSEDSNLQNDFNEQIEDNQQLQLKTLRCMIQSKQISKDNNQLDKEMRIQQIDQASRQNEQNQNDKQYSGVTHQQLLLGLMGIEQQLKRLEEQSQENHSIALGSKFSEENCEEQYRSQSKSQIYIKSNQGNILSSENNIPLNQNSNFKQGKNILNGESNLQKNKDFFNDENRNNYEDNILNVGFEANPVQKKLQVMKNSSYQTQNSSQSTQIIENSQRNILTPSNKINILESSIYDSNQKNENMTTDRIYSWQEKNYDHKQQIQFNEINEFCLEDDEDNPRIETSTMSESKSREFNKIKEVIYYIVNNLDRNEEMLSTKRCFIRENEYFSEKRQSYLAIFEQLIKKFKHLRKTKEEKTKFIMRKAFRFLFAQLKMNCNSKMNLKEANEICMKHYFSQHVNDSQFVLPFRRNSSIKTMNSAFLKKVFSSSKFVQDYKDFLNYFDRLAIEDNSKKVDQLAYYILPIIEDNKVEKVEGLRRLPWTMCLLDSTRNLAYQLQELEENYSVNNIQQINADLEYFQNPNRQLRDSFSIFNSPSVCNNICQSHEDNFSNTDTFSIETINRKVNDPLVNIDLISRRLSISSVDSQNQNGITSEIDDKQGGDNIQDYQMNCLKQINNALQQFQHTFSQQQLNNDRLKSRVIKRDVIILSPPLYDLNEQPHKKFQFKFCQ